MEYRIIATHDTIGKDDIYLSDATTEQISDEITDSLEACTSRLHEIVAAGKANAIEVIHPHTSHSDYHTAFYAPTHPFSEVEYTFSEIDEWATKERLRTTAQTISDINPDTQMSVILEDGLELPF